MLASDLLGRAVLDRDGTRLGKAVDLLTTVDADGTPRITAVLVAPRRRGRLLGYERPGMNRPWVINRIAAVLHRGLREVPWDEACWEPDEA